MELPATFSIRFLLFPRGEELVKQFNASANFLEVRQKLHGDWPAKLEPIQSIEQIRLIYCGKELQNKQTIEDVLILSKERSVPTVHIVVKKTSVGLTSPPKVPQPQSQEPPTQEYLPEDWHLHGCAYNDEEIEHMRLVFKKKRGDDGLISFEDIQNFLQVYWKWMIKNKYHGEDVNFPNSIVLEIKMRVLEFSERASYDQFLEIFFLFDNDAPQCQCPHGGKARVEKAAQQLHKALKGPEADLQPEVFENVFLSVDKDKDGQLSCKEVELFFYMYSVQVSGA